MASPSRTRRRLRIAACLTAGLLGTGAAYTPWWYSSTTTGTGSTVDFYPGTSFYAGGGGGGGTSSYFGYGLTWVGALYTLVLGGAIVVVLTSWVVAGYQLGASRGKWDSGRRLARGALLGALLLGGALAIGVSVGQPALYRLDNPSGTCASAVPPGPCGSFWGASHGEIWGAGLGWWLDLGAVALLAVAAALGTQRRASAAEAGGNRAGPG